MKCNGGSHSGEGHSVTSRGAAREVALRVKAAKSSEYGEGEL